MNKESFAQFKNRFKVLTNSSRHVVKRVMNNESSMCRAIKCLQTADVSSRVTRFIFRCVETAAARGGLDIAGCEIPGGQKKIKSKNKKPLCRRREGLNHLISLLEMMV